MGIWPTIKEYATLNFLLGGGYNGAVAKVIAASAKDFCDISDYDIAAAHSAAGIDPTSAVSIRHIINFTAYINKIFPRHVRAITYSIKYADAMTHGTVMAFGVDFGGNFVATALSKHGHVLELPITRYYGFAKYISADEPIEHAVFSWLKIFNAFYNRREEILKGG